MDGEGLTPMWQLSRNRNRKRDGWFKEVERTGTLTFSPSDVLSILHFEIGTRYFHLTCDELSLRFGDFGGLQFLLPLGVDDPRGIKSMHRRTGQALLL
jgi:hypothetical protein